MTTMKETKRRMTFGTRWLPPSLYDLYVWQELAAPASPVHALAKQVENFEISIAQQADGRSGCSGRPATCNVLAFLGR